MSIAKKSTRKNTGEIDEFEEWKRGRILLKPPDQLTLTPAELGEEIPRQLTGLNLLQPDALVEFDYSTGAFVRTPSAGDTVVLLNVRGTSIHRESEEAKRQMNEMGEEVPEEEVIEEGVETVAHEGEGEDEGEGEGEEGEDEGEDEGEGEERGDEGKEEEEGAAPAKASGPKKKLTNQFNFCERDALTYNNPFRSQGNQTIPPSIEEFGALVYQWIIYDIYAEDFAIQQREKEKEKKVMLPTKKGAVKEVKQTYSGYDYRLVVAWKTLERMCNLNTFDDIAKDYRYFEDPSDEYKENEGNVLPLWKFSYEKTKKSTVTGIMWNPWYYDLFVVSFGTFDYKIPSQGAICMFTLKNPSFPEHICLTEYPAMCVDTHTKFPFMIVCGLYNGTVSVYNVTVNCKEPQYTSNPTVNKHNRIVWAVKWCPDLQEGEMNFFSISADGLVNNWVLMANELSLISIITLYLDIPPVPGPNGTFTKLKASASCMAFHPANPIIYMIGTEEGLIYKCSTLYTASYLFTYKAHDMPVYAINYNNYNDSIFISSSADWRIKIWEDSRPEPLYVFDLNAQIGDVQWAPYSSTVFGAITQAGKVYIYDLNMNKYEPICMQNVVSKKKCKLTRLSFNTKLPILIVGDDRGCIHTLKISPNLRIMCKASKKQANLDQFTMQCMKLDKLLSLVIEPPTLTPPPDVETVLGD